MVGRDPALGDEQMKAGPRSAHRGNTIIQRLPIGFVDLIEVPGVRRIETHQVDGDRGVATAPRVMRMRTTRRGETRITRNVGRGRALENRESLAR